MRITCIIGPFLPIPAVRGGAVERIFLSLCEEFAKRGHDVTMISRRFNGLPNDETSNGVRHLRIPSHDAPASRLVYRLLDIKYAILACSRLPQSDVTITHSVSLPVIIPKRKAGKVVVSVARYPKGQMRLYKRADRLQGVSSHITEAIKVQSPSVAHLAKTIPNCLSERFCQAMDVERGVRKKQISYVGRIAREKGIHLLVAAFSKLWEAGTDWSLKIVGPHEFNQGGDGPDLLQELKVIAGESVRAIDFTGPIYNENKLVGILRESEIFVYPSIAAMGEALPLAPVEAMACGCTVVLSKLDCFKDYLVEGMNGTQFNQTDEGGSDLAAVLNKLIMSPEVRTALAEGAVRTSRSYTPQKIAELFITDFNSLYRS